MINRMKLRVRLTLLMAIILFIACSVLTFSLVYSANKIYQPISAIPSPTGAIVENRVQTEDAIEQKVKNDKELQLVSLVSIIIVFITGVGATYIVAGKALAPITKLSREIEKIDENNLFTMVQKPKAHDEIAVLSTSFNNMINKLEKAFAVQKQFSANVAHELKTPLAAIISKIEVCKLDENPTSQEYNETLDDILYNTERLSGLVSDLLEMYAEFGLKRYTTSDLREMFNGIIEEASQNNPKSVVFDNRIDALSITGDLDLLYRAFLNLTQNAVKYNKTKGIVTISAQAEGDKIVVSVSDTGIGIPDDQLERIFDPFYCVDKSRSRLLGGNGLGLSLVKTVVEKHNGAIDVKSEIGRSTTISVTLPQ